MTKNTWPTCVRFLTFPSLPDGVCSGQRHDQEKKGYETTSLGCCGMPVRPSPALALAAEFDGSQLSPLWGMPFAGILLSIALMPLLAPIFWHHHFGKVTAAWSLAFLLPFASCVRPGGGWGQFRACAAGRVHPVHPAADGVVHCGGRHLHPGQPARQPGAQYRDPWPLARCWPVSWAPRARRCC